jgi:integrase
VNRRKYPADKVAIPSIPSCKLLALRANRRKASSPAGQAVECGLPQAHLTETEIEELIEAAKTNRYGQRDATMILVTYRHGLRASELCDLKWDAIDFRAATLHVTRKKGGQATTHQISANELRALRKLQKEQDPKSAFVFVNERLRNGCR